MEHEPLDDWIESLLPTHSRQQIARIVHIGLDRVRTVRDAQIAETKLEEAEGRMIQPLISAGKTEVRPGYAEAVRIPATWNKQLDDILVRMVDERARRWNAISGLLGNFTESECKNRWMFLTNLKRLRSGGVTFAPN
jgi:hypothetical protein